MDRGTHSSIGQVEKAMLILKAGPPGGSGYMRVQSRSPIKRHKNCFLVLRVRVLQFVR